MRRPSPAKLGSRRGRGASRALPGLCASPSSPGGFPRAVGTRAGWAGSGGRSQPLERGGRPGGRQQPARCPPRCLPHTHTPSPLAVPPAPGCRAAGGGRLAVRGARTGRRPPDPWAADCRAPRFRGLAVQGGDGLGAALATPRPGGRLRDAPASLRLGPRFLRHRQGPTRCFEPGLRGARGRSEARRVGAGRKASRPGVRWGGILTVETE